MYFASAANLLNAIGHDQRASTRCETLTERDGSLRYEVTAVSAGGEIWRSCHTDLLLAVVMLERLMKAARDDHAGDVLELRPMQT
jgi:hypothetical protein